MPTDKLYWADPFQTTFETRGARIGAFGERRSVVLPATIFYPEAGGQLADTGSLEVAGARLAIEDVQLDDDGAIHHVFSGDPPPDLPQLGDDALVRGAIDPARRRDHMVQHTAQHALSRALVDVARAETVSARLGSTSCTIDVDLADVADGLLGRAEDLVNGLVMGDVPVRALFPSAEELARLPLRRAPKVERDVRVIDIEGFDMSPCGGTHCTKTGQIGQIRVAGTERYKGKLRVTFHAGLRALADARAKEKVLGALANEFTCGALDVPAAVGKLRKDLEASRDLLGTTRGELLELLAERILAARPPDPSGATVIHVARAKDDLGMLRALAARLAARADVVAICTAPDPAAPEGVAVVVQRGSAATFDCGGWLKNKAQTAGGRGGGRPERAEGRLPKDTRLP